MNHSQSRFYVYQKNELGEWVPARGIYGGYPTARAALRATRTASKLLKFKVARDADGRAVHLTNGGGE